MQLVIEYHAVDNPQLEDGCSHGWGVNRIGLTPGRRQGRCCWRGYGDRDADRPDRQDVTWEAFDLAAANQRPRATYLRSRRYARFRSLVLSHDSHRCALTGDTTVQALEAVHLVPARDGENDICTNGVALRADLRRLFDAGLFTFGPDGRVVLAARHPGLSAGYRRLLRNAELHRATVERVGTTLAAPVFRYRKLARA